MFGLSGPLLYLIAGIAFLAALAGLYGLIDHRGYTRGAAEVTAAVEARDNKALAEANKRIQALQEAARAQEQAKAAQVVAISTHYQKEISDAKVRNALLDADVRAGRLRLRDPGAASTAVCDRGQTSETAASPGRSDGPTGGQLSAASSGFLLALTGEADDVTRQLGACQSLIRADRQ